MSNALNEARFPSSGNDRVMYVSSQFPCLRQAFEFHQVLVLQEHGATTVFSCRKGQRVHAELGAVTDIIEPTFRLNCSGSMISLPRVIRRLMTEGEITRQYWPRALGAAVLGTLLAQEIRARRVSHIHASFAAIPGSVAYVASFLTGIPFSMTAHAVDIFTKDPKLTDPFLRAKIRESKFTAFISDFGRRYVTNELGIGTGLQSKLVVNRCGIDVRRIAAETARLRQNVRREGGAIVRIVSCGGLVRKKGFHNLIEACKCLVSQGKRVECHIYGDGPEKERLISQAGTANCKVDLHGAYSQAELPGILAAADLFVLGCTTGENNDMDGIPVVCIEAMAARVPVVCTSISGIPELVENGVTGLLASPDDIDDLADCIERLSTDPALQSRLSEAGYQRVTAEYDRDLNSAELWRLMLTGSRRSTEGNPAGLWIYGADTAQWGAGR